MATFDNEKMLRESTFEINFKFFFDIVPPNCVGKTFWPLVQKIKDLCDFYLLAIIEIIKLFCGCLSGCPCGCLCGRPIYCLCKIHRQILSLLFIK